MSARNLLSFVSGLLAVVVAAIWIPLVLTHRHATVEEFAYALPTAFLGACCAAFVVQRDGIFTLASVFILAVLGDLFAVVFFQIPWYMAAIVQLANSPPRVRGFDLIMFPLGITGIFMISLTIGNIITRGLGFVMMLPAGTLLLWHYRRRAQSRTST